MFEKAGIATVALSLVREQAEAARAPRVLHCQFPLGRPLGKPADPAFQKDVLRRAFALLERRDLPVLDDYPIELEDETDAPATCPLPPRSDPAVPAAVDEVRGLRAAYERQREQSGRTFVGRFGDADAIVDLVERFIRLAAGATLAEVEFDQHSVIAASQDIRAYYEEAGLALAEHVPAARKIESWFYGTTATGAVLHAARAVLAADGAAKLVSGYLLPMTQRTSRT